MKRKGCSVVTNSGNVTGKLALVTGASGGIGAAICRRLRQEGWSLVLVARGLAQLESLQAELLASTPGAGTVATVPLDLTQAESAQALLAYLQACTPRLDLLIHAAGTQRFAWLAEQDEAALQQQVSLNLLAPIRLTRALLPLLGAQSTVVNVGSTFGAIGYPGFSIYCATKAGLRGFTEALARELGSQGPRICLLAPRATATELNQGAVDALNQALKNGVDSPESVANELMQLLGGRGRERYIGWPEKLFARLNGLLPGVVDRAIAGQLEQIRHFAQSALSGQANVASHAETHSLEDYS